MRITRTLQRFSSTSIQDKEKFNQIKDWWTVGGSMQALWQYNHLRVKYIHDVLGRKQSQNSLANLRILDVGVGGGILSESLRRLGAEVVGLDVSEQSIETANGHKASDPQLKHDTQLNYLLCPPEQMDEVYHQSFDVVTAMEVIEHVHNKDVFVGALKTLLKPQGTMFLSTIDKTLESYMHLIVGAEYVTRLVPIGTHQWDQFIPPDEMKALLRKHNLEVINIQGAKYDLLTGEMVASENLMQYMIAANPK